MIISIKIFVYFLERVILFFILPTKTYFADSIGDVPYVVSRTKKLLILLMTGHIGSAFTVSARNQRALTFVRSVPKSTMQQFCNILKLNYRLVLA